ncbi:MAG: flippase-like domain-containing protein [Euryarchaeota archaeon]|nr:flippase-like domain-containing protein [Euryarchaeota archaeon]
MQKKKIKVLGLFTLGILIILFIIRYIGVKDTLSVLRDVRLEFLALGILTQIFAFYLWGQRWKMILKGVKEKTRAKNLYVSLFSGVLINNITPAVKTGGEPVRAFILGKKEKIGVEKAFATITADRVFDSIPYASLSLFAIVYLFFFKDIPHWVSYLLFIALSISIFLLLMTIYLCVNMKAAKKLIFGIIRLIKRFFPQIKEYEHLVDEKIIEFNTTVVKISKNKMVMAKAILTSFFMLFCAFFRVYFMFLAVGLSVNFIVPIIVTIIALQVNMIPIFPGGLGTTEGVMIIIFSIFGIASAVAASVTLLDRLVSYWLGIFIGTPCFIYSHRSTQPAPDQNGN